jgi:riboflavin synthase
VFTGLVETIGIFRRCGGPRGLRAARATIETELGHDKDPLVLGESVSINGVCLTVDRILASGFEADLSAETLDRTTLGSLATGTQVHLERATKLGGRMGGHTVLGHVDAVGTVVSRTRAGDSRRLVVRMGGALGRFVAPKGSITLDGVSLTLNDVVDQRSVIEFSVMLVPHTLSRTALGDRAPNARLNVEVDVLARYVARDASWRHDGVGLTGKEEMEQLGHHDERLLDKLRSGGFL